MQSKLICIQRLAILLIASVTEVSFCDAQESAKPPVQVRGLLELIKVRGVYEDLELVDFQKEVIDKAQAERQVANRNLAAVLGTASLEEQKKLIAEFKATEANLTDAIAKTLLPAQLNRLKQIRMNIVARNDGATFGLNNREFLAEMELTDAQRAEIAAKAAEANKIVEEKVKKLKAEIEKVKLEARDEIIKVLTPEQRKKYLELVGRPFEGDQPK